MLTLEQFNSFVNTRFGGMLESGAHSANGKACALESYSQAIGKQWTDNPKKLRIWDIRPLNDIDVDPKVRAKHIIPVLVAYQGSMNWPEERQKKVSESLVILTINRIIANLPDLSVELQKKCRSAKSVKEAREAAAAAAEAAAEREKIFIIACGLFLDAAEACKRSWIGFELFKDYCKLAGKK